MKQTAVEWLDEKIEYISIQIIDGFLTIKEFMEEREKLFKQAKEMEKQQKKKDFEKGYECGVGDYIDCENGFDCKSSGFEEYYNTEYGGEK